MPLVAGVDSSTSACKVVVRDVDTGTVVAFGRAPHQPTTPPVSEQDPHEWWSAFETASGRAGLGGGNRPAAISVAGQQHGLVVVDAHGAPLRPAKLWNDTTSAPDADQLVQALSRATWATACGSVPVPAFTITKLAWLRRCEPEVYARIARLALPHDWLTGRLTGGWTTDRGDASGTGWWSPAEGRYRMDLLALVDEEVDWAERLPAVLGPTDTAGTWEGVVVGPGTGDNMAAALGMGLGPGDLGLSLGTSGTAFCRSDRPMADPSGVVAGFADATGAFLPLVCTLNATKVTDAVARLLDVDLHGFDELALSAPAGGSDLVLLPYLDGERTPDLPGATGRLTGIRSDVTRGEVARAAVEGVVCNLLAAADSLPADGQLVLTGGGARSAAFRRVVADLTGRSVLVPDEEELVACGAAVQAAAVLTGATFEDIARAWGLGRGTATDPSPGVDGLAIRARYEEVASGVP